MKKPLNTYTSADIKTEDDLQIWAVAYLKKNYPHSVISGNFFQGSKQNRPAAMKAKAMGQTPGMPDLLILAGNYYYGFLGIELKVSPGKAVLKRGGISTTDHVMRQAAILARINRDGGLGIFSEGIEQTRFLIDWYMESGTALDAPAPPTKIHRITYPSPCLEGRYTGKVLDGIVYSVKM